MAYSIEYAAAARDDLKKLDPFIRKRVAAGIEKLQHNPFPSGVKKLNTAPDLYRIRIGDYRVIYTVRNERLLVLIVKVGHRRDVYRGL